MLQCRPDDIFFVEDLAVTLPAEPPEEPIRRLVRNAWTVTTEGNTDRLIRSETIDDGDPRLTLLVELPEAHAFNLAAVWECANCGARFDAWPGVEVHIGRNTE